MNPVLLMIAPLATTIVAPPPAPAPVAQQAAQQNPADLIDFALMETRMTVPVTIGLDGPYRFVVDTGAERTVISRELAGALKLAAGRAVRVTAMAGSADVDTFLIPQIKVGSVGAGGHLTSTRIEAPALIQRNLGAAGLVGIDALQGHAVTIDFPRKTISVTPATRRTKDEQFGPDDIVVRAKNLLGQLVVTDATYRGRVIRVIVDTGSAVTLGNLAFRRLVAQDSNVGHPVSLLSVTGNLFEAEYFDVKQVRIGETGFASLPIAFSDAPPFTRLGLTERPALLLGMDALRTFGRIRIDFANRELRLARPEGV